METQKKTRGTSQSKPRQMASKTCANNLRVSCECRVKKLFTAVLPKRVYKTHTPCIHYHLRDKSHRSHHGFIKRARQTPSLLTLSPFPLFSSLAFSASFLLSDLFPSSSISWAMLAVSISFFNLDLILRLPRIRQLVRHSVWSHIFSRSVFSVLFPFCLKYFTSYVDCFGCICFQFFPCYYFQFLQPLPGFQSYVGV